MQIVLGPCNLQTLTHQFALPAQSSCTMAVADGALQVPLAKPAVQLPSGVPKNAATFEILPYFPPGHLSTCGSRPPQ